MITIPIWVFVLLVIPYAVALLIALYMIVVALIFPEDVNRRRPF